MESSYFLVPLLIYIVLLVFTARPYFHAYVDGAWRWSWKNRRDWFFLGVVVFLSQINEYHQFFFLMLLPLAGVAASLRHRNPRILAGAAILLASAGLSTVAKMVLSGLISEPGLGLSLIGTPISGYGEEELYGLKMIQVILPVNGHHLESFRALRGIYDAAHIVNENSTVALGLFGAVGFVYLLAHGVSAIIRKAPNVRVLDLCSLLTLCCVLIATVGGVASVAATAGRVLFGPESLLTQVRCYNRIIVFIAFFSYYACSVLLMRLAFRASAHARGRLFRKAVVAIVWLPIFVLALWDQVPFQLRNNTGGVARYESDRDYFSRIEAQLAPRSLIFQYPFNMHHTNLNGPGLNYADGIRPYLSSKTLRSTYGGDPGSPQIKWLEETSALAPERMIERLCEFGFSGILVHRTLFVKPEDAAKFETQLSAILGSSLQESRDKEFSFAPINRFCARNRVDKLDSVSQRVRLSNDNLADGVDFSRWAYPNFLAEVSGISVHEAWGRWTNGPVAKFRFKEALPRKFTLEITANAFGPNTGRPVKVRVGSVEKDFVITENKGDTYRLGFETDGKADTLEITPPQPTSPNEIDPRSGDTRKLGIAFFSLKIKA